MYEAMARRYRPATFSEVIGQEHVAQTLQNAINTGRVAHAYLFCGPHGCGKTSMARIFACSLVCAEGPTAQPCGKCPICKDVLRGQDVDVQEIDGASNNGVEQVRALREQAGYIPSRARFKIYIIDEVHMLSVAAFNALLKTLEEPPAHVKFILATTDPHKILGTILSRCQRFDFRLVPPHKMSEFFKTLVEKENASITEEALDAVAAFSGGSMRDGLVLLDQLVSYAQGEVTREDVEQVRGVAGAQAVAGIYEAILCHDISRALGIVDEVAARGTSVGDFLDQLIDYGRDIMYVCGTGKMENITAYGPARSVLQDLANSVTLEQSLLMLDVFAQARTRVRSRALSNPLVPLEMAVARLAGLESLSSLGEIIGKLEAVSRGAPLPQTTSVPPQRTQQVSQPSVTQQSSAIAHNQAVVPPADATPLAQAIPTSAAAFEPSVEREPTRGIPSDSTSAPVVDNSGNDFPVSEDTFAETLAENAESQSRESALDSSAEVAVVQSLPSDDSSFSGGSTGVESLADERPPWEDVPAAEQEVAGGELSACVDNVVDEFPVGIEPQPDDPVSMTESGNISAEQGTGQSMADSPADENAEDNGVEYGYYSDDEDDDQAYLRDQEMDSGFSSGMSGASAMQPLGDSRPSAAKAGADMENLWTQIRDVLAQRSPADNSLLSDVYIEKIEDGEMFLSVPGGGSFIFEQLEDKHRKGRLAECAAQFLGHSVEVRLSLRDAIGDERPAGFRGREAEERLAAEHDPAVQMLVRKFDGRITNII